MTAPTLPPATPPTRPLTRPPARPPALELPSPVGLSRQRRVERVPSPPPHHRDAGGGSRGARWLLAGGSVAAAAIAVVTTAGLAPQGDADLVRLLRAMAAIKGVLLVAALAGLTWRLHRPVPGWRLGAYLGLAWTASACVGLMWSVVALGPVAVVLHVAAIAAAVVAWRDPDFIPAPDGPAARP